VVVADVHDADAAHEVDIAAAFDVPYMAACGPLDEYGMSSDDALWHVLFTERDQVFIGCGHGNSLDWFADLIHGDGASLLEGNAPLCINDRGAPPRRFTKIRGQESSELFYSPLNSSSCDSGCCGPEDSRKTAEDAVFAGRKRITLKRDPLTLKRQCRPSPRRAGFRTFPVT